MGRSTPGAGAGVGGAYTPVAAGSSSPLSSITIGNTTPDFAFSIDNDPAYAQLKNALSSAGISDAAHLRGAIQQALIQFGAVPNLPTDVLQTTGLDTAGTQALADNNPFSTLKQLQQSYQDQTDSAKNQLAARGILSSGETGYQLGRLGQQQGQAQYNATNSLLGNIGSLNDQYVQGRQAAAQQLATGAFTAEQNAAAANAGAPSGSGVTATWDPSTGLYKDPNGNYYNQGGNAVSLPSTAPSAAPPPLAGGATQAPVQAGVAPGNVRTSAFGF